MAGQQQKQKEMSDDADDNDVMITDVTSVPRSHASVPRRQSVGKYSGSFIKTPQSSAKRKPLPVANALNVMTKMGLNTTNPRILQALQIMQKTKAKRGPKEKDTFQRFIYCLPHKMAKLPRFSSTDDMERAIVKQQQEEGYGYPPNDYNLGIPLRTHLDIHLSAEEFDAFLRKTYPKLANRYYDMYKIDKQRRLIRIDTLTPRAIKDMKYQGSLIIIPYEDPNDKPPPILYRCAADNYALEYSRMVGTITDEASLSLLDHQQIVETITTSLQTTDNEEQQVKKEDESEPFVIKIEADNSDVEMETTVTSSNMSKIQNDQPPAASVHKEEGTLYQSPAVTVHKKEGTSHELSTITVHTEADTSHSSSLQDLSGIFERTEYLQTQLKDNAFYIHIDDRNLVQSLLQVYRQYLNILEHKVVVCCIDHQQATETRHQQNPLQPYLVRFWDEIFELCFEGNNEKIPVCAPDIPEDIFILLGRIMYHGLVLQNYWPVRLSQACCSVIMTDGASEKQLAESFQKAISDDQKAVISAAKTEIRAGATNFDYETQVNLCKALRAYGNNTKPDPKTLNDTLIKLTKFCLIQRPYWCLCQMRSGLQTIREDLFRNIDEKDVFMFYSTLMPSALSLFDKIVYLFSTCEDDLDLELEEKRVKTYLENVIMTFHSIKLRKLLLRWCQSDCLNTSHVYVRFSRSAICQRPVFDPDVSTVTLSSVYTSQEEFSLIMSQEI